MKIPFCVWLFQGIPECIGSAALLMSLGLKELLWKKILIVGLIQAVFIYVIRLLPLTPYSHTFLVIPVVAFAVSQMTAMDIRRAHIYAVVAILTIAVSELGFYFLFDVLGLITLNEIFKSNISRIICGWPHVAVLFGLALLINRLKRNGSIIGANTWKLLKNSGNARNI